MKTNIGISDANRNQVVDILNRLLADEMILYTKTRNYHWNVVGAQFSELHSFFEVQYDSLADIVDDVAERVRALGANALGTLTEFLKVTRLTEEPNHYGNAGEMVGKLLSDHEAIVKILRQDLIDCDEKYSDVGTSDFLTGLMEKHEKMAWMLRAYLS